MQFQIIRKLETYLRDTLDKIDKKLRENPEDFDLLLIRQNTDDVLAYSELLRDGKI